MEVKILGAGGHVGRSCAVVSIGGSSVMFDCGVHMGQVGEKRIPQFDMLSTSSNPQKRSDELTAKIDVVVVTHFHIDHCGALPHLTEVLGYKGPILMTFPTKAVASVLLSDCCKMENARLLSSRLTKQTSQSHRLSEADRFYTEDDVWKSMSKVIPLQLHETFQIRNIRITPYYAGHVIGASMFHLQVGNVSVVYTGDYNTYVDRHLACANVPVLSPDLVISESTYATFVKDSKRAVEREFCTSLHECLSKGGKVLVPMSAVGRAQELSILLESYWNQMNLTYPIYFGGTMSEKANSYYRIFTSWTQQSIYQSQTNAFVFPHISSFDWSVADKPGPMVLFATPGQLYSGLSLSVFKTWCVDEKNMVVIPGYCVAGTVGNKLIQGQRRLNLDADNRITEVKCKIKYLSFSAHADSKGIQAFLRNINCKSIIFVHGEYSKTKELADYLTNDLEIPTYVPLTGDCINFEDVHSHKKSLVKISRKLIHTSIINNLSEPILDPISSLKSLCDFALKNDMSRLKLILSDIVSKIIVNDSNYSVSLPETLHVHKGVNRGVVNASLSQQKRLESDAKSMKLMRPLSKFIPLRDSVLFEYFIKCVDKPNSKACSTGAPSFKKMPFQLRDSAVDEHITHQESTGRGGLKYFNFRQLVSSIDISIFCMIRSQMMEGTLLNSATLGINFHSRNLLNASYSNLHHIRRPDIIFPQPDAVNSYDSADTHLSEISDDISNSGSDYEDGQKINAHKVMLKESHPMTLDHQQHSHEDNISTAMSCSTFGSCSSSLVSDSCDPLHFHLAPIHILRFKATHTDIDITCFHKICCEYANQFGLQLSVTVEKESMLRNVQEWWKIADDRLPSLHNPIIYRTNTPDNYLSTEIQFILLYKSFVCVHDARNDVNVQWVYQDRNDEFITAVNSWLEAPRS